ncbi:MAG: hypothetical protein HOQ01_13720, partial [Lysobacter sp.]|nr:hypothetical protein [Lysobacter sp.]
MVARRTTPRHPREGGDPGRRPGTSTTSRAEPRTDKAARPTLSSPDRIVFPDVGLTKRDVFEYYEAVAPRLLEDAGERL